jgi:hypothetical protein
MINTKALHNRLHIVEYKKMQFEELLKKQGEPASQEQIDTLQMYATQMSELKHFKNNPTLTWAQEELARLRLQLSRAGEKGPVTESEIFDMIQDVYRKSELIHILRESGIKNI